MTFFGKQFSFSRKISDDLLLIIDQVFRIFFSQIIRIFTMLNVVYDPFLTRTTTISEKNSFMTLFLLCSYFRTHPTTLLLKILGGRMHGPPPPQILGGPSPSPSRSPPLIPSSETLSNTIFSKSIWIFYTLSLCCIFKLSEHTQNAFKIVRWLRLLSSKNTKI